MAERVRGRKLLVASIGVAAVSYVACSSGSTTGSGNLMPPPPSDAASDAPGDAPSDALLNSDIITSGNLAPPLSDAGND